MKRLLWPAVLGFAPLACATKPGALDVQPFAETPLRWGACPEPWSHERMDCARVEVPRDWEALDDERVVVVLRRRRAEGEARGQLWCLDGGPGFAGDAFFLPEYADPVGAAGLDLIVPSHRGTIDDSALICSELDPNSVADWERCVAELEARWGDGVPGFDSTSAARDVSHLMERVPSSGAVLVFGGSYGSLWGQRLLQARPQGIERMWLDSIVDLEGTLERSDEHADAALRALLDACAASEACATMFAAVPSEEASAVLRTYEEGAGCAQSQGFGANDLQALMYAWLNGPPTSWALAAAGYARAARCTPEDEGALLLASERLHHAPADGSSFAYNVVLNHHVIYRELYRFDVDVEQRETEERTLLATRRADLVTAQRASAFGPRWRHPGVSEVPESDTELVLLSGHLDPLDPPRWAEATAKRWANATLISAPWAGHSVLRYLGTEPGACGRRLFDAFLHVQPLQLDCVAEQAAPGFTTEDPATATAAEEWFGTELF